MSDKQISPFPTQLGVNNLLGNFDNLPPGASIKTSGIYQPYVTVSQLLNVLGDIRIDGKFRTKLNLTNGITSVPDTNLSITSSTGIVDFGGAQLINCSVPTSGGFVTGPNVSTSGNFASFNGTSGSVIQDSGVNSASLVTLNSSQTLTNKTLDLCFIWDSTTILNTVDNTRVLGFNVNGTTGTTTYINTNSTASRSLNIPSGGTPDVFALLGYNQTFSNKSFNDNTNFIISNTDISKRLGFDLTNNSTTRTLTIATNNTTDATLNIPNVVSGDTLATVAATQTLTNKTLTSPVISNIVNGGNLAVPSGVSSTLATTNSTQNMGNKTFTQLTRFYDNACAFQNLLGNKLLNLNLNSAANNTITEVITTSTADRFINLPDASGTLLIDTSFNLSLFGGNLIWKYFTFTTTNATPVVIDTVLQSASTAVTVHIFCNVFCTAGPDVDKYRGIEETYVISRSSASSMSAFIVSASGNGSAAFAPALSIIFNPTSSSIRFTGIAGDTLNVTGNFRINY